MSSAGAQCSHIIHVATQVPYALLVAGVSFVFYILACIFNEVPWLFTIIGCVAMVGVIFGMKIFMDKKNEPAEAA